MFRDSSVTRNINITHSRNPNLILIRVRQKNKTIFNRCFEINRRLESKLSGNGSSFRKFYLIRCNSNIRERKNCLCGITIFHGSDLHRDGNVIILCIEVDFNRGDKYTTFFFNDKRLCKRVIPTNLTCLSSSCLNNSIFRNSIPNNFCITNSKNILLDCL